MWCTRILAAILTASAAQAQQVLHFTATSGYDHGTRNVSLEMFQSICAGIGCTVHDDANGSTFNDPQQLALNDVVIFSNTSGNTILDIGQRANFEAWVNTGGHVLGLHAASDSYRHSTANGTNTGTWDFYAELIGASVQEGPNHVDGTPPYALWHIGTHASTANLPDPWVKYEEYYYWEGGYFGLDNQVVLEVQETIGPNGQVNSYDAPRPVSWVRTLSTGTRVFYTALGHAQDNYTDDDLFRQHISDALIWVLEGSTDIHPLSTNTTVRIHPNPTSDQLIIAHNTATPGGTVHIVNAVGVTVLQAPLMHERTVVDLSGLAPGPYLVRAAGNSLPLWIIR